MSDATILVEHLTVLRTRLRSVDRELAELALMTDEMVAEFEYRWRVLVQSANVPVRMPTRASAEDAESAEIEALLRKSATLSVEGGRFASRATPAQTNGSALRGPLDRLLVTDFYFAAGFVPMTPTLALYLMRQNTKEKNRYFFFDSRAPRRDKEAAWTGARLAASSDDRVSYPEVRDDDPRLIAACLRDGADKIDFGAALLQLEPELASALGGTASLQRKLLPTSGAVIGGKSYKPLQVQEHWKDRLRAVRERWLQLAPYVSPRKDTKSLGSARPASEELVLRLKTAASSSSREHLEDPDRFRLEPPRAARRPAEGDQVATDSDSFERDSKTPARTRIHPGRGHAKSRERGSRGKKR